MTSETKDWKTCVNICKKEMKKKRLTKKELIDMVYGRFKEKDASNAKLRGLIGGVK